MVVKRKQTPLTRKGSLRKPSTRKNSRNVPKKEQVKVQEDLSIRRIIGVGIFFTIVFLALGYRAFTLQIIRGPELGEAARRQQITTEYVNGVRGNILDRQGNVLARSIDSSSVWINPTEVKEKARAIKELSEFLTIPESRMSELLRKKRKFIWLARKIDNNLAEDIKKLKIHGVYIDHEYTRVYPYKSLVGQLLGFVDVDQKGLEGIEKAFDSTLSGERVKQIVQRDAIGRRLMLRGTTDTSDLRGQDVRLTIDTNVQFFAEEALSEHVEMYGAKWGGCLVVDATSGDILAWAQYPFFDPNEYNQYAPEIRRNRIAMDSLEQGSTIKSFLIAAALEEKKVNPDTVIDAEKGKWKLGKVTIHDTHPYDTLSVKQTLHVSSNIGAAKIGLLLGSKTYYSYLTKLGFGSKTGLPLSGEAKGILRPWTKWGDIDLASASFGQSFSATLIQMAQAYLVLASDGKKKALNLTMQDASLAEGEVEQEKAKTSEKVLFSPDTMKELRSMLRLVVEEVGGTGKYARIPGMEVGGKTGTAQKADSSGKYGQGRVGSFVGMVPIDKPRYLICVLLDEPTKSPYGGVIAAPVFRSVALNTMAYHGLLPDSDDPIVKQVAEKEALRKSKHTTPNQEHLSSIKPVEISNTVPERKKNGKFLRGNVPVVIGLSLQQAVETIAQYGEIPNIVGTGSVVISQSPKAGTTWPAEKGCTIWLGESK